MEATGSYLSRLASGTVLVLTALTACGTTGRFVAEPTLTVNEPHEDTRRAVAELFGVDTPYTVKLCDADPVSKECKEEDKGIRATGVGGFFLPLTLHVTGIMINRESQSTEGLAIDSAVDAKVDAISPICATVHGTIVSRDNDTASVQLRNFYCNWVLVGNVLVNADLSIDTINLKAKVFSGYYRVTFHGTGNAAGSGYYRAVIAPKTT